MNALGVLDAIRPAERTASERVGPVRPGGEVASLMAGRGKNGTSSWQSLAALRRADAERSQVRALQRVEAIRTSTSLAALAQTNATLGEGDAAAEAAREALDLSVQRSLAGAALTDAPSARIATEVLLRCGHGEYAYDTLRTVPLDRSMILPFAVLASSLGRSIEAEEILAQHDGPLAASFRGYLQATAGQWQQAVHHLREAVREEPADVDALLNLSIALWNLGSVRKATRIALRATRIAPGRKDISLHYMDVLLAQGDINGVTSEITFLKSMGVVDSKVLVIQARTRVLRGEKARALTLLEEAASIANTEGDRLTEGTALGNLALLRYELDRWERRRAVQRLADLMAEFPDNEAIAINFAQIARSGKDAPVLRQAMARLDANTSPIRRAYFRHQLAVLEGDTESAGFAAEEWFELEPNNPMAAAAAIISMGIGQSRWSEAVVVADHALAMFPRDRVIVNNSAYVLAMSGRAEDAIRLLEPAADDHFVLNATLGLAYLAHGDLNRGMRLYREAADMAESADPNARSLMTAYQALVIRQLGLDESAPAGVLSALALVPVDLPEDWNDRPEFLQIYSICVRHGYPWPLQV